MGGTANSGGRPHGPDPVIGSFFRTRLERARASLFFVPMAFVVLGALLGVLGIVADGRITTAGVDLPFGIASTVDSARAVLSTVASATMTFAGIAFSVALLVFQQSSSQYSPRVVQGFFQDSFNKRVIGVVVGTFTYCLIVLRSVHGPLESDGDPVIPTISVSVAVVFGLIAVLSIVAFIDHNAHRLDVSEILHDVSDRTTSRVEETWAEPDPDQPKVTPGVWDDTSVETIPSAVDGWVQRIEEGVLLEAIPEGSTLRLDAAPSRYTVRRTVLARISPTPDPDVLDDVVRGVQSGVVVGPSRTLSQDPAYGLRQLVDVALKALSPGINDPTTAQDAIFHIAAVLHRMLDREPPAQVINGEDGRCLVLVHPGHGDLIDLAFDELRLVAANQPTVCEYLLESIRLAGEGLTDGHEASEALRRQAQLVVAECQRSDAPEWDFVKVRANYEERFGPWSEPKD